MEKNIDDLYASVVALQTTVAKLSERIASLEGLTGLSRLTDDEQEIEEPHGNRESGPLEDPLNVFANAVHASLREDRKSNGSPYALSVGGIIAHSGGKGSAATSYTFYNLSSADELISEEKLPLRMEEYTRLLSDPLILRILRQFLVMRFAGESAQASAEVLGKALNVTGEQIETTLQPLVQDQTLRRGLYPDGTAFYEWDGNSHRAMAILFFHR